MNALTVAALLLFSIATAHAEPVAPPFLRVDDSGLAAAVIRGAEQSPTFRAILERLASSDLIVYLRRGRLLGNTAAATQLLTASGGYRYVRVTLEPDPASDAGLALLGHELWHALELAEAKWVIDSAGVHKLYQRIGYRTCEASARCYDTDMAVTTGYQVLRELRRVHARVPLDALGLPVTLGEEPGADAGEGEEGKADGDEGAGRTKPCTMRKEPRERDLEQPEHHQVDPRGGAGVAGAVERLGQDHAVTGERKAERNDAETADAVPRHLGIAGEDGDEPRREEQEAHADRTQEDRVVQPGLPRRRLRAIWLAGAQILSDERRGGVAHAKGR
jgi:hypothetical protein